jgi:hypothetical protein
MLSKADNVVLPAGYWKQTGAAGAEALLVPGRRVIVTEFGVELIDLQAQGPFKQQMAVNPPPLITGPITPLELVAFGAGVCANVAGLGRKHSQLAEDQQRSLAKSLLLATEADFNRRGLTLLSLASLNNNKSYADLKPEQTVKSSLWLLINVKGSDTGTVLRTHTVAAPGAGLVTTKTSARLAAEQRVLRDSGADIALGMRLRVGVFHKKAALEEGSVVRLVTRDGETEFKAQHSILSDEDTIESSKFKLFIGEVEPLASEDFSRACVTMLPKFLDLAYRMPTPEPGTVNLAAGTVGQPYGQGNRQAAAPPSAAFRR